MNIPKTLGTCIACLGLLAPQLGRCAIPPVPGGGGDSTNTPLNSWSFADTNAWTSDRGYEPVSFANLSSSPLGQETALVLDSPFPAWLQYNVVEEDGTTNLTVDNGTVLFWFAANWTSASQGGTGPGGWGRLLEVGTNSADSGSSFWGIYIDPQGNNIYFAQQTNGAPAVTNLSASIDWATTNRWHLIALTYSATNSALYLDGTLVTNGPGLTCWPGAEALDQGFCIGSDSTGVLQAHGMFDQLYTYDKPVDGQLISSFFSFFSIYYYVNPMNRANLSSAPITQTNTPVFRAVSGPGNLQTLGSTAPSPDNSNVWITNVSASSAGNGTMAIAFEIGGGTNGVAYDVFANAVLGPTNNAGYQWVWEGQATPGFRYLLTNMPSTSLFLMLGTPQDSDTDGLTDAYERLISHTDPSKPDSSGDGMMDGWKVLWGLNPFTDNAAQNGQRFNYTYHAQGFLWTVSGIKAETVGTDNEGNVLAQ
jgi:hypothetical protein